MTTQHQDDCLILIADEKVYIKKGKRKNPNIAYEPSRATKMHRLTPEGGWSLDGYQIGSHFDSSRHVFNDLRGFFGVMLKSKNNHRAFLVADEVAPGINRRRVRRAIDPNEKGEAPGLARHSRGHHWICWEVDKVEDKPDWFDPASADRSKDAAFARWWVDTHLPDGFKGRSMVLQWSSSALFKGKISMHLWMWMDRPVYSESLHYYFQERKAQYKDLVDVGIWDGARVHYIADPHFYAEDGSRMADPLAGHRWLWVDGPMGDVAEALPEWLDRKGYEAAEAEKAAKAQAEAEAAKARRAAEEKAAAESYAARKARAAAKGETVAPFNAGRAVDEADARGVLAAYRKRITKLTADDSKHEEIRSIAMRAVISIALVLGRAEIQGALEDVAVEALVNHDKRARSKSEAVAEVGSIFDSAFAKAKANNPV